MVYTDIVTFQRSTESSEVNDLLMTSFVFFGFLCPQG